MGAVAVLGRSGGWRRGRIAARASQFGRVVILAIGAVAIGAVAVVVAFALVALVYGALLERSLGGGDYA